MRSKTMKANVIERFGPLEVLEYRELPTPEPKAGEVLVRVTASGVNLGDTLIRSGTAGLPLQPPLILGSEAAGVIEALGEGVAGLTIGQRVLAAPFAVGGLGGGYATHLTVSASGAFALPDDIGDEIAVALGVAGITAHGLLRAAPLAGLRVLVHAAAGGVGNLLLQLLAASGATQVIGTVGRSEKAAEIERFGPVVVTTGDWAEKVKTLTADAGPDVIFDAVGGPLTEPGLDILAAGGHYIAYGGASGTYPAVSTTRMPGFVMKAQTLTGFSLMPLLMSGNAAGALGFALDELFAAVRAKTLIPLIGHRFALADAAEAHRLMESRASTGKIVLVP
jgi:NADPH2:quinone reductase